MIAELACQPNRKIPAERVARHADLPNPVDIHEFAHDSEWIRRQARVIQARRQMLGSAAVALVQQHRVPASARGLRCKTAHVMRLTRAFESVQGQ